MIILATGVDILDDAIQKQLKNKYNRQSITVDTGDKLIKSLNGFKIANVLISEMLDDLSLNLLTQINQLNSNIHIILILKDDSKKQLCQSIKNISYLPSKFDIKILEKELK